VDYRHNCSDVTSASRIPAKLLRLLVDLQRECGRACDTELKARCDTELIGCDRDCRPTESDTELKARCDTELIECDRDCRSTKSVTQS
jgi:hypothetical protein